MKGYRVQPATSGGGGWVGCLLAAVGFVAFVFGVGVVVGRYLEGRP